MIIINGTYGEAKVFTDNVEPEVIQDIRKILDSPVAINALPVVRLGKVAVETKTSFIYHSLLLLFMLDLK